MSDKVKIDESMQPKKVLIELKDFLEDLKIVRSDAVKKFIFENVYKFLGTVELTIDSLFQREQQLQEDLNDQHAINANERKMHQWLEKMRQYFKLEEEQVAKENLEFRDEDARVDKLSDLISTEADLELPPEEVSAYVSFLGSRNVYSFKSAKGLKDGELYGTMFRDPAKEAMYAKADEAEQMPVISEASAAVDSSKISCDEDCLDPNEISSILYATDKLNAELSDF